MNRTATRRWQGHVAEAGPDPGGPRRGTAPAGTMLINGTRSRPWAPSHGGQGSWLSRSAAWPGSRLTAVTRAVFSSTVPAWVSTSRSSDGRRW